MKNLYRVTVRKTNHHYVSCTVDEMADWRNMLIKTGHSAEVAVAQVFESDFDEINHIHFC